MDCDRLLQTIDSTKEEIYKLKQQVNNATDPEERRRLKYKLQCLRKLQFQQINQLG